MQSISQRVFTCLAITTFLTSVCAYGWIYWETKQTESALRQQALLDRANVLASYLELTQDKRLILELPRELNEAYSPAIGNRRFAVSDESGRLILGSGLITAPLPSFRPRTQAGYYYDSTATGPRHIFGVMVRTNVEGSIFFIQIEEDATDSRYLREAVKQEFLTDGGWLQAPFLSVWFI